MDVNKAISGKDFTLRLRSGCKLAERSRRQRVICLLEISLDAFSFDLLRKRSYRPETELREPKMARRPILYLHHLNTQLHH